MSAHKLDIDVQEMATMIQEIRSALDKMEEAIQKALLKENGGE